MAIVRRTRNYPVRTWPAANLLEEFDRLFNEVAPPFFTQPQTIEAGVDLYETNDALVLEMAVPGLGADDLDISIEERRLAVRAELPEVDQEGRRYWLQTLQRGELRRSIGLPASVDVEAIEAHVHDGILKLTMPKVQEAKVRKISVTAN